MYRTLCLIPNAMARPPKSKNLRTPLRVLRSLLSERGEEAPISQLAFSQLIDVPVSTVKAIENGQRVLNSNVVSQVVTHTGALWHYPSKQWMDAADPKSPFTYEIFAGFRRQRSGRPDDWETRRIVAEGKLAQIFNWVENPRWWEWYLRCAKFLEDSWVDFNIKAPPVQSSATAAAKRKETHEAIRRVRKLSDKSEKLPKNLL
jgi:predicted DCC family thiol-disulfide oxidoreductase YuxK